MRMRVQPWGATLGTTAGLWGQTAVGSRGCGAEDAHTLARRPARKAPQLSRGAVAELEQRTAEFLVVAPAADGILVNRLPHQRVARGRAHPRGRVTRAARTLRHPVASFLVRASSGGPCWGVAACLCTASGQNASSPADRAAGCEWMICATSVVPERGMPTTKAGRIEPEAPARAPPIVSLV